jgi:hypothetical protein
LNIIRKSDDEGMIFFGLVWWLHGERRMQFFEKNFLKEFLIENEFAEMFEN